MLKKHEQSNPVNASNFFFVSNNQINNSFTKKRQDYNNLTKKFCTLITIQYPTRILIASH